jgi:hypothetical protein
MQNHEKHQNQITRKHHYDRAHQSFAPIPAFVDTGSAVVDKSNVDAFLSATKSITGQ